MENKIKTGLTNVSETLLIPLWAKATETDRKNGFLRDEKATEILEKIEYDFSKLKTSKISQAGCCLRASLIDKEVIEFLDSNPDATVIELGVGLDARYERIQRYGITHWYDLDLPDVIKLRRQFLPESNRHSYIEASMFDYGWIDTVKKHKTPVCIIIEGVLMYFSPDEVKAFFIELCNQLESAVVLFDMIPYKAVGHSKQHDALSKIDSEVEFLWSVRHTKEMEKWHPKIKIRKTLNLSDYEKGRFPSVWRILYKIPFFYRNFNQRVIRLDIV